MKIHALLAFAALSSASAFGIQSSASRPSTTALRSSTFTTSSTSTYVGTAPAGGALSQEPSQDADPFNAIRIEGGSLRTWSFSDPDIENVQVLVKTDGRPFNANIQLWCGPNDTPQEMGIYCENGQLRPFSCVIPTPKDLNSVCIRNSGKLEFPLTAACLEGTLSGDPDFSKSKTVQGGATGTYPFAKRVDSILVMLKTDGRPLNCRIELLQGPANNKQVVEIYTEDGLKRPFFAIFETPGAGNVARIVNTATVEYPLEAVCQPYTFDMDTDGKKLEMNSGWEGAGRKYTMLQR